LTPFVIFRYFLIGTYVGCATIGIFTYWYLYFQHADGHSLIPFSRLSNWNKCETWTDFTVNSFDGLDLSTNPCLYFTVGKRKPVTLALTVLVIIEMFNAMNAISDEQSLLVMPPSKNLYLVVAIFASVAVHCMILYVPFFNDVFGISPLDSSEWILVIFFSFPVILLDELIKLCCRLFLSSTKAKEIGKNKIN
jgi:P-type Ca2+ transporter type 2C